ncbi:hypothetical protein BH09PSE5_BH09PSE5_24320 [soil metagenome]
MVTQSSRTPPNPLSDDELLELQSLLDTLPKSFEPLDTTMLDGFLCGVLLQPQRVPQAEWLRYVTDVEGQPLPAKFDPSRLHALTVRRYVELDDAIERRQWFDPWIFEFEEDAAPSEAVYAWVAGFSTALELFPSLMRLPDSDLLEPLATLYAHLDPDDLEDADELLAEIETMEPAADLEEAVEGLVRSTLHLADVSRPVAQKADPRHRGRPPQRGGFRR